MPVKYRNGDRNGGWGLPCPVEQLLPVLLYIKNFRTVRNYVTELSSDGLSAEARLAARRAARAEAREIRMRELEKQQKDNEDQSDREYNLVKDDVVRTVALRQTATRTASLTGTPNTGGASSYTGSGSRRSSEDSTAEMDSSERRDLRHQVNELEDKFRKAMISNAQLDNEKSALIYQVDRLKDELEEVEELYLSLQKDFKDKSREYDFLKRDYAKLKEEANALRIQIEERDRLISEYGLVLIQEEDEIEEKLQNGDINSEHDDDDDDEQHHNGPKINGVTNNQKRQAKLTLLSQQAAQLLEQAGEGSLHVRLKRFAEDKQDLMDQIRRLQLDLDEERQKTVKMERLVSNSPQTNGPDMKILEIQRESSKLVNDYKFKLQKAEADINSLQGTITRLENQIARFKTTSEESEKVEDELKAEKRRLQRELRESNSRVEELETANNHLEKRIEKLKSSRTLIAK